MKSLSLPKFTVREVVEVCIPSIRDVELSKSLAEVQPVLDELEAEFVSQGGVGLLFGLARSEHVGGRVSSAQMEWLYTNKFVPRDSAARKYYDLLMMAPVHGRCPLCGHRLVATIDHYLPKESYAQHAVTPANLIPACMECNFRKRALVAALAEEQTLHPYFDRLPEGQWLNAEVLATRPPTVLFQASPPQSWPEVTRHRLARHFELFGLAQLYAAYAASELGEIEYGLREVFGMGGASAVREHLERECRSRVAHDANSWQSGLYRALSASTWFYTEGFATLHPQRLAG